jgi:hypothetical protein
MINRASVAGPQRAAATGKRRARRESLIGGVGNLLGRVDWAVVGGLALLALFLKPSLHGAFRADDTWNSVIRGNLELTGESLPGAIWTAVEHYIADSGRPNVLGIAQGSLTSWLFVDEFAYHAYLIATTLLAAGVLYALVR